MRDYRKDFPILNDPQHPLCYLDNSATSLKPQCVIDAMVNYYARESVNVHRGDYTLSVKVSQEYENTREVIRRFINAPLAKEIVYTSGTTMSINTIAYGYGETHLKKDDVILLDVQEHASNSLPWFRVAEKTGARIEFIELDQDGRVGLENFKKAMHKGVKLVAVAQVSNVLGMEAPVKEICQIAHEYGAVVLVDGAQSVPHMKVDVSDMDCDFFCFSGHKMCGPTGIGVLYGKYELLQDCEPLMLGGGMNARFDSKQHVDYKDTPYKFEAGTPAIAEVLGLKAAIEYLEGVGMENIQHIEKELHEYALEKLAPLTNITIYNPHADHAIVAFNVHNVFAQDSASYLSTQGVACRSGNHCAKMLIDYLGEGNSVRCSLYFYNTKEDIDQFVEAVSKANEDTCLDVFF